MASNPLLVLASGSPRRLDLLTSAGLNADVRPADVDETPLDGEPAGDYVERLARSKAGAVGRSDELVIGADTAVVDGAQILGKPIDSSEAKAMLRSLSARRHRVLTGVAARRGPTIESIVVATMVEFRLLTDDDINWYVGTGEPMDKAGSYAIQGRAASFVRSIEGSVTNVIGLPLAETLDLVARFGIDTTSLRSHR
ncbi:MAG: septum formation inhibitor Maf [Actinomycetia bacterium]|nr:septum formation inhibitor Maf [Actinomycetes bacterium]